MVVAAAAAAAALSNIDDMSPNRLQPAVRPMPRRLAPSAGRTSSRPFVGRRSTLGRPSGAAAAAGFDRSDKGRINLYVLAL